MKAINNIWRIGFYQKTSSSGRYGHKPHRDSLSKQGIVLFFCLLSVLVGSKSTIPSVPSLEQLASAIPFAVLDLQIDSTANSQEREKEASHVSSDQVCKEKKKTDYNIARENGF